jgi:hypothetical protein
MRSYLSYYDSFVFVCKSIKSSDSFDANTKSAQVLIQVFTLPLVFLSICIKSDYSDAKIINWQD